MERSFALEGPRTIQGSLAVPGDKSISHRALLMALIAHGRGRLLNFSPAGDCRQTLEAARNFGFDWQIVNDSVEVTGDNSRNWNQRVIIQAGNSGTTARLLMGMAGFLEPEGSITIYGDSSLSRRPMERVAKYLHPMGLRTVYLDRPGFLPLRMEKNEVLQGISQVIAEPSAQVKSAVLLAGLAARGSTEVYQAARTRNHTELMVEAMGGNIVRDGKRIRLDPGPLNFPRTWTLPGDISSAAWWAAMAAVSGQVILKNVGLNETRTGFIQVLEAMGANISVSKTAKSVGEPVGDLLVSEGRLRGIELDPAIIPRCIDELPALAAVAAFAQGETIVRGAEELIIKETNRISEIAQMLFAFGARCRVFPDGFAIRGGGKLQRGQFSSRDHRMVMAASIMAALIPGTSFISDTNCIQVSYPGFLKDLDNLTDIRTVIL